MSSFELSSTDPKARTPKGFQVELFDCQKTSLAACIAFEKRGYIKRRISGHTFKIRSRLGILGDMTGFGKSMTMLALTSSNRKFIVPDHSKKYYGACSDMIQIEETHPIKVEPVDITLIVVPNKLVVQWEKEIALTGLKSETVPTTGTDIDWSANVIICRASRYNYFMTQIADGLYFQRIVFDEPDTIGINSMVEPHADMIWLVTATPHALSCVRKSGWIKRLFWYERSHYNGYCIFDLLTIACASGYARSCVPLPPIQKVFIDCLAPVIVGAARGLLPPAVQTMMDAGDLAGAVRGLGGQLQTNDTIIEMIKKRLNNRIGDYKLLITKAQNNTQITPAVRDKRIKKHKEHIKSLKEKLIEFTKKIQNIKEENCPICYDTIEHLCMTPCCQGLFCHQCICNWMGTGNSVCPLCRGSIAINELIIKHDTYSGLPTSVDTKSSQPLAKSKAVIKILKNNPRNKFLLFSELDGSFVQIQTQLQNAHIRYERLGGHAGNIRRCLTRSETGNLQVILMNAKRDGAGLNMPWIDNIIVYHKLSEHTLTQVIGRTSRIGQKNSVKVWFLQHTGEYTAVPDTSIFD